MIKSLRNQLALALCVLAAGMAIIQGVSSYQLSKAGMSALLDMRLEQVATRMRGDLGNLLPAIPVRGSQPEGDVVITIWKGDFSNPYRTTDPSLRLPPDAAEGFKSLLVGGERWRVYTLRTADRTIQVAQRSSVRQDLAEQNAIKTLWPMLVLVPLVWISVIAVINLSLRQLTRLGEAAKGLDVNTLSPLSTRGVPREIRPFIDSINLMIERLARSIELERKFISDAAHELRTPLTALQIQADNLIQDIFPSNQERFRDLRGGILRAGALVTQMLRLARADAPLHAEAVSRVDISAIVVATVAEVFPIAVNRNIDIGAEQMADAHVNANEADVCTAVRNLVTNAIRYTPDGGQVDLRVRKHDDMAWIDVIDTGPGIAEELVSRVFDRFFRANAHVEGSGLGLSIVKALATKYGGVAIICNRNDGRSGIVASIGLPLTA